jgi:NhaP-type Na+/H+ or K+/H+ antiporter
MYNNVMGEIILTVVAAFATYLVSDQLFHVSGVLAVVVLGANPTPPLLSACSFVFD